MNLKIDDIYTLNVLQVAVDDLVTHLRDLPSHDAEEALEFADRLRRAETLKGELDKMQEDWPVYERMREFEAARDRSRYSEQEREMLTAQMQLDAGIGVDL